jgi:probable addiction module antidote protein
MSRLSLPLEELTNEVLQDPEVAAAYLEEVLAENDIALFKIALKNIANARAGGMTALAEKTSLTRDALYKALSDKGNPRLDTLNKVLAAAGLRLSVSPAA